MLEALGLSTAESRVYQLLVGFGRCPVGRLEQRAGLTGAQLEQAVAALAVKGLVTLTDDLPAQLIPAPPDIAGETLLLARMNELQSAKGVLQRLTKEYREALRPAALEEIAEIVPAEALAQRYEQLQLRARREVLRFDAPPYLLIEEFNVAELEQLAAGCASGRCTTGPRSRGTRCSWRSAGTWTQVNRPACWPDSRSS